MSGITSLEVGSALSYLIAFGLPCLDAVFPILPSETVIIAFGVATAGSSDPRIFLVLLCAAIGAWAGDNLCYLIGWRFGPWATRRFFAPGSKSAARRDDDAPHLGGESGQRPGHRLHQAVPQTSPQLRQA